MPPKGRPGRTTIGIAIKTQTDEERQLLERDLIEQLRIISKPESSKFDILKIPSYLCVEVSDADNAKALRARALSHFLTWGDIRKRLKTGKEKYVLAVRGIVVHASVEESLH